MRFFIFLSIAAVTFYFAGMYKKLALLVIFAAEILLLAVMFITSIVLSRKISISFKCGSISAIRGLEQSIFINVVNKGVAPLSKIKIKIKVRYDGEKSVSKKLFFGALPKSETDISFIVTAPYCGIASASFSRIYPYDFLSLFRFSKKSKQSLEIITLPDTEPTNVANLSILSTDSIENYELPYDTSGSSSEIRHLREYRSGDQIKHIHWNQTARMQQVYVKEFEQESGGSINFYLNLSTHSRITPERKTAFYEVFYSIVLGLLKRLRYVNLMCRDFINNKDLSVTIGNTDELNEAMSELYKLSIKKLKKKESDIYVFSTGIMLLDFDLNWYYDRKLIFKFTLDSYANDISSQSFYLPSQTAAMK